MSRILAGLIAGMALLAGCSSEPACGSDKDAFLTGYFSLVDKASDSNLALSDAEWEKYDERFRAYVEECYDQYEGELVAKEKRKFWSKAMKYYVQRYGDGVLQSVGQTTDKTGQRISEKVKEFFKSPLKALEKGKKREEAPRLKLDKAQTE